MDHWRYNNASDMPIPEPLPRRPTPPPQPKLIRVPRTLEVPEEYSYPPSFNAGENPRILRLHKDLLDVYGHIGRIMNDHSHHTRIYDANLGTCDASQRRLLDIAVKVSAQSLVPMVQKALDLLSEISAIGGPIYIPPPLAQEVVFNTAIPPGSLAHLTLSDAYIYEEYPLPPGVLIGHNMLNNWIAYHNYSLKQSYEKMAFIYNRMNFLITSNENSRARSCYAGLYDNLLKEYDLVFSTIRNVHYHQANFRYPPSQGALFSFPTDLQEAVEEILSKEPTSSLWIKEKKRKEEEAKEEEVARRVQEKAQRAQEEARMVQEARRQQDEARRQRDEARRLEEEARSQREEAQLQQLEVSLHMAKLPQKKQEVRRIFISVSDVEFSEDDSEADSEESADIPKKVSLKMAQLHQKKQEERRICTSVSDVDFSEDDSEADSEELANIPKKGSLRKEKTQTKKRKIYVLSSDPSDSESSGNESVTDNEKFAAFNFKDILMSAAKRSAAIKQAKTLYMGNVPRKAGFEDVKFFFEDSGEVVDVRFPRCGDGSCQTFCFVEFVSSDAAALKDNQSKKLLGHEIFLSLSKQRGAQTSHRGNLGRSVKPGHSISNSIFIRGFDTHHAENKIRSSLEQHFGECGEIARVCIPTHCLTGAFKGFAFMDFKYQNSVSKALKLSGSDIGGGKKLYVAKRRDNGQHDGGRSGDHSGGRHGGVRIGDQSGDSDGRHGRRGGDSSFGNSLSDGTPSAGKRIVCDDNDE